MVVRLEVREGVVYIHAKKGVILLEEPDYLALKKEGGYLGISSYKVRPALYAFVDFYPRKDGKILKGSKSKFRTSLHRYVMKADGGQEIDHINHNGLDNRKENLRFCSHKQNKQNSRVYKTNKLGLKGVTKSGSQFQAKITVNDKTVCLGSFPQAEMAARVYDLAAIDHFGEFASLNFSREEAEAWRVEWERIKGYFT